MLSSSVRLYVRLSQNSSTVELVDYTNDGWPRRGWTHAVYYTSVVCNSLIPLLRSIMCLLYNLFLNCYAAVSKITTDTSRRAVRLRLQSFLSDVSVKRMLSCYHIIFKAINKYSVDVLYYGVGLNFWCTLYTVAHQRDVIRRPTAGELTCWL